MILFFIFALSISCICFAQSDQSESLTITTYYPSPYGVYKTLRLNPSPKPLSGSSATQPGTMYFNKTENLTYVFNGSDWELMGAGGSVSSKLIVDSGSHVYPEVCSGISRELTLADIHAVYPSVTKRDVTGDLTNYWICSAPWYVNVSFHKSFKNPPQVFVQNDRGAGREGHEWENYTCARHGTDITVAYATNINLTGFRLWSSGEQSYQGECLTDPLSGERAFVKAEAAWMAIGE